MSSDQQNYQNFGNIFFNLDFLAQINNVNNARLDIHLTEPTFADGQMADTA